MRTVCICHLKASHQRHMRFFLANKWNTIPTDRSDKKKYPTEYAYQFKWARTKQKKTKTSIRRLNDINQAVRCQWSIDINANEVGHGKNKQTTKPNSTHKTTTHLILLLWKCVSRFVKIYKSDCDDDKIPFNLLLSLSLFSVTEVLHISLESITWLSHFFFSVDVISLISLE